MGLYWPPSPLNLDDDLYDAKKFAFNRIWQSRICRRSAQNSKVVIYFVGRVAVGSFSV